MTESPCVEEVACSFCKETGFDLIGLKIHLSPVLDHCSIFKETPYIDPIEEDDN